MLDLSKQRQNASPYTQVKVSINPEIASAFKSACVVANVSMASVLSDFMADYSQISVKCKAPSNHLATRRQRRGNIKKISLQIEQLMIAEEEYRDNFPENLHGSKWHVAANHSIDILQEVIELLEEVY